MSYDDINKLYFEIEDTCKAYKYECRHCEYKALCDAVNDSERPNSWNNHDFNKLEKIVNTISEILKRYKE